MPEPVAPAGQRLRALPKHMTRLRHRHGSDTLRTKVETKPHALFRSNRQSICSVRLPATRFPIGREVQYTTVPTNSTVHPRDIGTRREVRCVERSVVLEIGRSFTTPNGHPRWKVRTWKDCQNTPLSLSGQNPGNADVKDFVILQTVPKAKTHFTLSDVSLRVSWLKEATQIA